MSLNAGSVYATLGGRFAPSGFAQFDAAMKRSAASAGRTEEQIAASQRRTGASFAGLAKVGTVTTAAVAAGLYASVKASMNFEKAMSAVKAATGAGTKDMKTMSDAAMRLGASTGVGAVKAANALEELGKGGMSAGEAVKALSSTIALAQAGPMELADAASTVVQTLSTFNLAAKDSQMVADGLASAAAKTTMDVSDFAQALAQGGAAAQGAGFTFDETMNILGAMANRFKSGSDMGTSLKTTLAQLAHPTDKAAAMMKKLNIDVFDGSGKIKKASEIVKMLGDSFGKLTPKQKLAAAATIAGTDGMRTLLNLASATPSKIREQGSATDMARDKTDNLAGSLKRLQARFGNILIKIGAKVSPSVRAAVDQVTSLLADLEDGKLLGTSGTGNLFGGLKGDIREILLTIDQLLAGLSIATAAVQQFGSTMGSIIPGHDMFDALAERAQHATDNINNLRENIQVLAGTRFTVPGGNVKLTIDQAGAIAALNNLKGKKLQVALQIIARGDQDVKTKVAALVRLGIPKKYADILARGIPKVQQAINSIKGPTIDTSSALGKLNAIKNTGVRDKAFSIVARDGSAKAKVRDLIKLGIPKKDAVIMAKGKEDVLAQIAAIQGKNVKVPVNYVPKVLQPKLPQNLSTTYQVRPHVIPPNLPGNASGRGTGDSGPALVGEGRGPEWVGNPASGWRKVTSPTVMGLREDDYVIPTEGQYRDRAMRLMADALGLPGFAGGRKGVFKGKGKKRRYIPNPLERFRDDPEDLKSALNHAQQRYDGLRTDSREKKNGKLTKNAKKAKGQLGTAHDRLLRAKAVWQEANAYKARITREEDLIEIARSEMTKADQQDNAEAYKAAKGDRKTHIGREIRLLRNAMLKAPKGSSWRRELQKRLRAAEVDLGDTDAEKIDIEAAPTFTEAQQTELDKIDAALSLAELTPTKVGPGEDIEVLGRKEEFLRPLLAKAQATGNSSAVTEIAGMLKTTQDALTEAQKPPDLTADQQLTTDQAFQKGLAQGRGAFIDRVTDRAFGGGPQIIVNTLHPGDPRTVRAIGDAAAAGFGYQQPRQSSTARVGV